MISSRICVVDVEFHEAVSPDLLAQREKPFPLSAPRVRSELSQLTIEGVQRAAGLEPGRTELEQIIERCDLQSTRTQVDRCIRPLPRRGGISALR